MQTITAKGDKASTRPGSHAKVSSPNIARSKSASCRALVDSTNASCHATTSEDPILISPRA
jgi:hypothetical protein